MVKATATTLPLWEEDLPWDILPILFKDVIHFTRKLGVRYLWLDALCILQDDSQDWVRESANMASIYSNSYLTIAATRAKNPKTSLFGARWTRVAPTAEVGAKITRKLSVESVKVGHFLNKKDIYVRPHLHLAHDRFIEIDNAEDHVEDSPLLTRAWVFQERLLPVRTIHFHAEELVWECVSGVSCECQELHDEGHEGHPDKKDGIVWWLKASIIDSLTTYTTVDELGYVWLVVVTEYSGLRLTNESDRMPAISGIASKFSGGALGRYISGIWEAIFARGLCYYEQERTPKMKTRHSHDINAITKSQPSWSWTSTPLDGLGFISYNRVLSTGFKQDLNFKIISLLCLPATKNPFSWVANAELRACGSTLDAKFQNLSGCNLEIEVDQHEAFRTTFFVDSGSSLRPLQKLCCLLVGSSVNDTPGSEFREIYQYAIVLAECSNARHKRVGFLEMEHHDWFSQASIRTFDLV
jgi:hypothetical protein